MMAHSWSMLDEFKKQRDSKQNEIDCDEEK